MLKHNARCWTAGRNEQPIKCETSNIETSLEAQGELEINFDWKKPRAKFKKLVDLIERHTFDSLFGDMQDGDIVLKEVGIRLHPLSQYKRY